MPLTSSQNYSANPFDEIVGQSQVTRFLKSAAQEGRLSHAYIFVGPVGSGKTETAIALSKAIICSNGGCGSCDACSRIKRSTHPDVHWVEPEGVSSYLTAQIREVLLDSYKSAIRGNHKVYIITRGDLLRDHAANMFLKTLEEPPSDTTFILMARTKSNVLPTIISRCQTLVFRRLPDEESIGIVKRETGADEQEARIALGTVGGSTKKACEFFSSESMRNLRLQAIQTIEKLATSDAYDVIEMANSLVNSFSQSRKELEKKFKETNRTNEEFMSKGALSYIEKQQDRKLKASTRESLNLILSVFRTWLRDCLVVSAGLPQLIVNVDCYYTIELTGKALLPNDFARAQAAIEKALTYIASNVTPQLILEATLFDIREVLYANRSAG